MHSAHHVETVTAGREGEGARRTNRSLRHRRQEGGRHLPSGPPERRVRPWVRGPHAGGQCGLHHEAPHHRDLVRCREGAAKMRPEFCFGGSGCCQRSGAAFSSFRWPVDEYLDEKSNNYEYDTVHSTTHNPHLISVAASQCQLNTKPRPREGGEEEFCFPLSFPLVFGLHTLAYMWNTL